ncbi:MAG: metallophosphoesterase [Micrococcales bacterium]|nr:metallophosphoesterase [Micrococcales bacterium]
MWIPAMLFSAMVALWIVVGVNVYVAARVYQWLRLVFSKLRLKVFVVAYACVAVIMIVSFLPLRATLGWIGGVGTGLFLYLLMMIVVVDLVVLVGRLVRLVPKPVPAAVRLASGLVAAVTALSLVGYGLYNVHQVHHVAYDVTIDDAEFAGMRIVMISDLHLGAAGSEANLARVVTEVNAAKPDLVCIVGDTFNDSYNDIKDPGRAIELFASINSTYGTYASLGNHDAGPTLDKMIGLLDKAGVVLLTEEHVVIDDRLVLVGRADRSWADAPDRKPTSTVLAGLDPALPVVVMDHNPSNITDYDTSVDLIVCGHTHRGQFFPVNIMTMLSYPIDYGHRTRAPQVIVTSGAGTWGIPLRIGSNSEVVTINVHGTGH